MKRRLVILLCLLPVGLFLFLELTFFFIPNDTLLRLASSAAARQGTTLTVGSLRKLPPFALRGEDVEVAATGRSLFRAERLTLRLSVFSLLRGRLMLLVRGEMGGGTVTAEVTPQLGVLQSVVIREVRLEDIPIVATVSDGGVRGSLSADGWYRREMRGESGELRLTVSGLDVRQLKIGGMPLPDAGFDKVQGMLRIDGGSVKIDSLTLEGSALYARLSGVLPRMTAAPLNVTLEMMPKPEFLNQQKLVFLLFARFLVTPGHYRIPITGTLQEPKIL